MRRYLTPALIVAATVSLPLSAFAQDACPPGAWFCQADDAASAPNRVVDEDDALPPPPLADSLPVPEQRQPSQSREGRMPPPPVVVYQPRQTSRPSTQIIIIAPGGTHVVRKAAPAVRHAPVVVRRTRVRTTTPMVRPVQRQWRSEWGLNVRVQGVSFGGDRNSNMAAANDAGMGGFGVSLRYRPWARFALDAGFDVVGGTDFNGFERVETPFSVNGIIYFNPRSRSQFYVIGGVNWSRATVRSDNPSPMLAPSKDGTSFSADYKYFGGQLGAGLEFRLSKRLALNVDFLGFVRSRSDVDDDNHRKNNTESDKPAEFINAETGQTTNTSGGGLFRGGLTLWW
jgi:opacity protein-like surface antigen